MYSSTLVLTSALDEGVWSTPRCGRFTPGKDQVPVSQEAGWAPRSVWTDTNNLAPHPPPVVNPRTAQPVASRPTD